MWYDAYKEHQTEIQTPCGMKTTLAAAAVVALKRK